MAPSTIGSFLRTFTFGHIRQLDAVLSRTLARAWAAGAGPDDDPLVVDLDSTICEVHGKHKQGASYGYTKRLGYHPLLATRATTGEVLFARMRKGSANTARGIVRFVDELAANVRRAGASGPITVRADSGFWSWKLCDRLNTHGIGWSITVRLVPKIKAAIVGIDETAWSDIDYTLGGQAQVAETTYTTGKGNKKRTVRLVVRRTRLTEPAQRQLWPHWRHHAFITCATRRHQPGGGKDPPSSCRSSSSKLRAVQFWEAPGLGGKQL
ncbi:MAG: transposase [Actinomycetia bacterium]|nr:transposase [Actinomycetes bacterium]